MRVCVCVCLVRVGVRIKFTKKSQTSIKGGAQRVIMTKQVGVGVCVLYAGSECVLVSLYCNVRVLIFFLGELYV